MPVRIRGVSSRFLVNLTCLILAALVLLDLAFAPRYRPFGYLAADAFYYLNIARNWVESGIPSYDGVRITNGFHPLWQICVALLYAALRLFRLELHAPLAVVLVSLGCVVAAVSLLGRAWIRSDRSLPVAFATIPIGIYPLLVLYQYRLSHSERIGDGGNEGPLILHGTLFSYINGMESPLVLLFFSLTAWLFVTYRERYDSRTGSIQGGVLAALCLARLDHTAFALAPAGLWTLQVLYCRARRRYAASALLALLIPLGVYLGVNYLSAGTVVPVSGSAKSTFPVPLADGINFIKDALSHPERRIQLHTLYRFGPSIVSCLFALTYLLLTVRLVPGQVDWSVTPSPWVRPLDRFLVLMSPGVLLLGAYNLLFAVPSGIGHWYQPASVFYSSLVVLRLYAAAARNFPYSSAIGRWAFTVGFVGLTVAGFGYLHYEPKYHRMYAQFYWETVPRIQAALGSRIPPIYEMDDGIVAFGLKVPAMSATGLALDHEATQMAQKQRRVDIALQRGFRTVGAVYYNSHALKMNSSNAEAIRWASDVLGESVSGHSAKILYTDDFGTLVTID